MDLLDLYKRASDWTADKVAGAKNDLDAQTPCDEWKVRDLMNHLLDGNRYFQAAARGEQAAPPQGRPADLMGDDPVAEYRRERDETLAVYGEPEVMEKMGPSLGIAFVDQLVHGWDIAKATGQDTQMPSGLAEAAFQMVDGRLTDDQRGKFFKAEVKVPDDASAQEKLLAYTGRTP